jgi:hypothetical protein
MCATAAAAAVNVLLPSAPGTTRSALANRCGGATPIDASAPLGRATPLGEILWVSVYPFQAGYPTKTIFYGAPTTHQASHAPGLELHQRTPRAEGRTKSPGAA